MFHFSRIRLFNFGAMVVTTIMKSSLQLILSTKNDGDISCVV